MIFTCNDWVIHHCLRNVLIIHSQLDIWVVLHFLPLHHNAVIKTNLVCKVFFTVFQIISLDSHPRSVTTGSKGCKHFRDNSSYS